MGRKKRSRAEQVQAEVLSMRKYLRHFGGALNLFLSVLSEHLRPEKKENKTVRLFLYEMGLIQDDGITEGMYYTEEYIRNTLKLGALAERVRAKSPVGASELYTVFKTWCQIRDIPLISQKAFGGVVRAYFRGTKRNGVAVYWIENNLYTTTNASG